MPHPRQRLPKFLRRRAHARDDAIELMFPDDMDPLKRQVIQKAMEMGTPVVGQRLPDGSIELTPLPDEDTQ